MGFAREFSFSAADTNASIASGSAAVEIPVNLGQNPGSARDGGDQILRLFAEFAAASGSATIQVFIVEDFSLASAGVRTKRFVATGTVTGGATRTNEAGTGGNYLASIAFNDTGGSGRDTVDLMFPNGGDVFVVCTALTNGPVYLKATLTRSNS